MPITTQQIQLTADRELIQLTLSNGTMRVGLINYGATITSIETPDRSGNLANVVAGFADVRNYLGAHPYFGSIVGRFANRIAHGKFSIDGKEFQLPINNGNHHLHGGVSGFDKKFWQIKNVATKGLDSTVTFSYTSNDGEEGYPGNVVVDVVYSLNTRNEFSIEYFASTDRPSPINLTSHSYFNLSGFEDANIYDHKLQLASDSHTVVNEEWIPTGLIADNQNTYFDFSAPVSLGRSVAKFPQGYNHNFIVKKEAGMGLTGKLTHEASGRSLVLYSDQPGVQVYTANEWDGSIVGGQGKRYERHGAIALETQHFPDSPNHPGFPSTILYPDQSFYSRTSHHFDVI